MKKATCIIAVVALIAVLFASCATGGGGGGSSGGGGGTAAAAPAERRVAGSVPQFVRDAIRNAPEDALIGIGSYTGPMSAGRAIAATRARAEISRQMSSMIQDMVRDYTAMSEADPSAIVSFQEVMTVALSRSELKGATEVDFDYIDGVVWMVVQLRKTNVVDEINQAQAAAKLAVPAAASFNAEERMNAAFDKAYGSEVQIVSN